MTISDLNVERASRIDTATLSDALDKLGIAGQCLNIKPLQHSFRLAGRALTLTYGPVTGSAGTVGDYIDDAAVGSIIAIDNHGRENATVWGDILTMCAHRRGISGTVIDGACRDTALARELGYPIFSRSYSMRTGKDRVQLNSMNTPIQIGEAAVAPGDILRGDADGVLVIPKIREGVILDLAETIQGAEEKIRQAVLSGERLDMARKQQGYHELQRRERS